MTHLRKWIQFLIISDASETWVMFLDRYKSYANCIVRSCVYLKEEDLEPKSSGSGSCAIKKFKPALLGLKKIRQVIFL